MEKLLELGQKLGLEGKELSEFVLEREKIERDERATRTEVEKEKEKAQKEIETEAEVEKTSLNVQQKK